MDPRKKETRPENPNEVQIEVSFIKPDSVYSYDLYDEYGNVVLEAYVPFSESLLMHLRKENVKFLFYDVKKRKAPDDAGGHTGKKLINEQVQQEFYQNSKELLDYIRDIYNYQPESGISRAKIEKSREMVNRILKEIEVNEDGIFNPLIKLRDWTNTITIIPPTYRYCRRCWRRSSIQPGCQDRMGWAAFSRPRQNFDCKRYPDQS
jgi:hypothetical protein